MRPPAVDSREAAGQRLKRAIHVARARKGLTSDMQLSVQSGIAYDTLYNWYSGRTTPRGAELRKMATFLDIPFGDLQAVYDGREPEPPALQESVRDMTDALKDLVAELRLTRAEQVVNVELLSELLTKLETTPPEVSPRTRRWAQERAEQAESTRRPRPTPVPEDGPER